MSAFIKIVDTTGNMRLINVNYIEEVLDLDNGKSGINLAFNCPNATAQDNIMVNIPFNELVKMIQNVEENENDRA